TPPATPLSTPSLHDALPISTVQHLRRDHRAEGHDRAAADQPAREADHHAAYERVRADEPQPLLDVAPGLPDGNVGARAAFALVRSEEHTSELQSLRHLVCRL